MTPRKRYYFTLRGSDGYHENDFRFSDDGDDSLFDCRPFVRLALSQIYASLNERRRANGERSVNEERATERSPRDSNASIYA